MRRSRPPALAPVLLTGAMALTACGGSAPGSASTAEGEPPRPAQTSAATDRETSEGLDAGPADAPVTHDAHPTRPAATDDSTGRQQLTELILIDQPAGTGPEIALRFLRALQRGDDMAAARELFIGGRSWLAADGEAVMHTVMRDVAKNAGLASAGRCTSAEAVSKEAAVVRCGRTNVVVHVLADAAASGVEIAWWHPRRDAFPAPHTHAFTTHTP